MTNTLQLLHRHKNSQVFLTWTSSYSTSLLFSHDQGLLTSQWTSFPENMHALYSKTADPQPQIWLIVFILCTTYAIRKSCSRLAARCSKFGLCNLKRYFTNSLSVGSAPRLVLFFSSFACQCLKNYGVQGLSRKVNYSCFKKLKNKMSSTKS